MAGSTPVAAESKIVDPLAVLSDPASARVARSQKQLFWRQFRKHKLALIAAVVLLVLIAMVMLAPWIAPYEFDAIDPLHGRQPPSPQHWLGTDDLGRDLYTRLLFGGRISMAIGIFSALVGTGVGTLMGSIAGYYGKTLDNVIMRATDVAFSIPSLPLLIILSAYAKSAVPIMILIIGLLSWHRARHGAIRPGARLHDGRASDRRARHADYPAPYPPQRPSADHRGRDAGRGRGDHRGVVAEFSGAGSPNSHAELGQHAAGRADHDVIQTVADDLPGHGNPDHRAGH